MKMTQNQTFMFIRLFSFSAYLFFLSNAAFVTFHSNKNVIAPFCFVLYIFYSVVCFAFCLKNATNGDLNQTTLMEALMSCLRFVCRTIDLHNIFLTFSTFSFSFSNISNRFCSHYRFVVSLAYISWTSACLLLAMSCELVDRNGRHNALVNFGVFFVQTTYHHQLIQDITKSVWSQNPFLFRWMSLSAHYKYGSNNWIVFFYTYVWEFRPFFPFFVCLEWTNKLDTQLLTLAREKVVLIECC